MMFCSILLQKDVFWGLRFCMSASEHLSGIPSLPTVKELFFIFNNIFLGWARFFAHHFNHTERKIFYRKQAKWLVSCCGQKSVPTLRLSGVEEDNRLGFDSAQPSVVYFCELPLFSWAMLSNRNGDRQFFKGVCGFMETF